MNDTVIDSNPTIDFKSLVTPPSTQIKFSRELRQHQKDCLDRFAYERNAGLFWEMGTGKTTSAIAWLRAKFNMAKGITPTLIISPVATLYNWVEEFKINSPQKVQDACLVPYMKTKRTKYTGLERSYEIMEADRKSIIILNGESLDNDYVVEALKIYRPANLILDESQKFKSYRLTTANAKKRTPSRLAKLLSISDHVENKMILSGTPILNSYLDLWSQFRILDGGETFGRSFHVFRDKYFEDKNIGFRSKAWYFPKYEPKATTDAEVTKLIEAKCSRITKEQCLDLPPLVQETHHVELGPDQGKSYFEMENELITFIRGGACTASNALSRVNRLLQILSGHLPVEHDFNGDKILAYFESNPRLRELKELLEELTPKHKVIVWSCFTASYPKIREVFKALGILHAELTGETKNRQAEIERFQNDSTCRVMLANAQAGGVGVNLTSASYSIYYSRNYSWGDRAQSEARNHRGGSEIHKKITQIDLVAKGTLDEDVLNALLRKESFSDNILERLQSR